jgi:hypothetical protein
MLKYFSLEEIVDPRTFKEYGHKAWQLFPPDSLEMLDNVREFLGVPLTVNDWHNGGTYQFSGYRPSWCNVGAKLSAHRVGKGFDCKSKDMTAEEMRTKILADINNPLLAKINRLEGEVSWLHLDSMQPPQGKERIYIFKA